MAAAVEENASRIIFGSSEFLSYFFRKKINEFLTRSSSPNFASILFSLSAMMVVIPPFFSSHCSQIQLNFPRLMSVDKPKQEKCMAICPHLSQIIDSIVHPWLQSQHVNSSSIVGINNNIYRGRGSVSDQCIGYISLHA